MKVWSYISLKHVLWLLLALVMARSLLIFAPMNIEMDATKPYFFDFNHYYGGYGFLAEKTPEGWRTVHNETVSTIHNMHAFQSSMADRIGMTYVTTEDIDRVFMNSFIPSLIARTTFNSIHFYDVYLLTNCLFWLIAIYCVFRLTRIYYHNETGAIIAAILVAALPTITLFFQSVKIQYGGTVALLLFMLLHEKVVNRLGQGALFIYYFLVWNLLRFAAGSWVFVALFVLMRHTIDIQRTWPKLLIIFGAFGLSLFTSKFIFAKYDLVSSLAQFSLGTVFLDTFEYIVAFLQGNDLSDYNFFAYSGTIFFDKILPLITMGLLYDNPFLPALVLVSLLLIKRRYWLPLFAIAIFPLANASVFITGWVGYYGYNGGPTLALFCVIAGGISGYCWHSRAWPLKYGTFVLVILSALWFMGDYKGKLANYYGGYPDRTTDSEKVYIYHDNNLTKY